MQYERDKYLLYNDLAWIWPIISPHGEYIEETELFSRMIKEHSKIETKTLLHLGCGGGHNDYTFKKYFRVTGVDTSSNMLKLARNLNPEVTYYKDDMRTVHLNKYFDAVVILDSIAHINAGKDLLKVFMTAYKHLKPGGTLLTFAGEWEFPGRFKQNYTQCSIHSKGNVEIVFIENYYDPDPTDTNYETTFIYLIRKSGRLETHMERHLCGTFKTKTIQRLLEKIGFKVEQIKFKHSTFNKKECFSMLVGML